MNKNDPSLPTALLAGFNTMKGKPVLFSHLGYDDSWPKDSTSNNHVVGFWGVKNPTSVFYHKNTIAEDSA